MVSGVDGGPSCKSGPGMDDTGGRCEEQLLTVGQVHTTSGLYGIRPVFRNAERIVEDYIPLRGERL
jgi:hypothetical protein